MLLFFASSNQRFDSGCSSFFHPVQLFVLHPISNGELAWIQPLECGFIKRDKAPVLTQDVTLTGLPYQLRDGSLPPHFSPPLADLLEGVGITLTLAARNRSFPKCSSYSTVFPTESTRISAPSREERSKQASRPSSPRMNPQPSFWLSREIEPRISAPCAWTGCFLLISVVGPARVRAITFEVPLVFEGSLQLQSNAAQALHQCFKVRILCCFLLLHGLFGQLSKDRRRD